MLTDDPVVVVLEDISLVLVPGTEPVEAIVLEDDPIALVILFVLTPELLSAIVLEDDPILMAAVFVLPLEPVEAVKLVGSPMLLVAVFEIPVEPVEAIGLEDEIIPLVIVLVPPPKPVEEVKLGGVLVVLVAVFMFSLGLVGNPVALVVVPIIPPELVETVVPVREPVALVAVLRLPLELVLKLEGGSVARVPLVGGGVITNVTVLEVSIPVPDDELRGPMEKEIGFVEVVVVGSGLAFEVAEEPGALVKTKPENADVDCVGPEPLGDTEILMHNGSEQVCNDEVDDELRGPVEKEIGFVEVVVVGSGLAFEMAEEPGALVKTEPENVDVDCVRPGP